MTLKEQNKENPNTKLLWLKVYTRCEKNKEYKYIQNSKPESQKQEKYKYKIMKEKSGVSYLEIREKNKTQRSSRNVRGLVTKNF